MRWTNNEKTQKFFRRGKNLDRGYYQRGKLQFCREIGNDFVSMFHQIQFIILLTQVWNQLDVGCKIYFEYLAILEAEWVSFSRFASLLKTCGVSSIVSNTSGSYNRHFISLQQDKEKIRFRINKERFKLSRPISQSGRVEVAMHGGTGLIIENVFKDMR